MNILLRTLKERLNIKPKAAKGLPGRLTLDWQCLGTWLASILQLIRVV